MFYSITDKKQIESLAIIAEIKETIKKGSQITCMNYDSGSLSYFVEDRSNFVWYIKRLDLHTAIKIESVLH